MAQCRRWAFSQREEAGNPDFNVDRLQPPRAAAAEVTANAVASPASPAPAGAPPAAAPPQPAGPQVSPARPPVPTNAAAPAAAGAPQLERPAIPQEQIVLPGATAGWRVICSLLVAGACCAVCEPFAVWLTPALH